MATMNISLPDQMKQWVEDQVATGRYANASDYVRDLMRKDQLHAGAVGELQRLVDESIASGISDTPLDEVIAEVKRRGREALKRKNAAA